LQILAHVTMLEPVTWRYMSGVGEVRTGQRDARCFMKNRFRDLGHGVRCLSRAEGPQFLGIDGIIITAGQRFEMWFASATLSGRPAIGQGVSWSASMTFRLVADNHH
jgi:hypothetical protein